MSLTVGSSTSTASLVTSNDSQSGSGDVAAIEAKLAAAQKAQSEAEAAGDTEEATTQQALVTKYTADLAKAKKAAESETASAGSADGASSSGEAANPYKPIAQIDVTTLAASDASAADPANAATENGTSARPESEAERAEKEYRANMPGSAEEVAETEA